MPCSARLYAILRILLLSGCITNVAHGASVTDYAPETNIQCPDVSTTPLVRVFSPGNQSLHPLEVEYVESLSTITLPNAWESWLGDGSALGYNLSSFSKDYPKIGLAFSGGGYRAAQFGAGVFSALDSRNASSKSAGTGGLLQVSSYLSALSGGSWLASSLYSNDWPTIPDLVFGNGKDLSGWLLDLDLIIPDGDDVFDAKNQEYFGSLVWSVMAKASKGFQTSLTDPWSRALSYHFLNQTSRANFFTNDSAHGAGQLWSRLPLTSPFQQRLAPFPLVVANSRPGGSNETGILPPEATVYEISAFELASFDPGLSAATNITFVGTSLTNGNPTNSSACVTGFDEVGFVMGTSSNLFNSLFDKDGQKLASASKALSDTLLSGFTFLLTRLLQEVRSDNEDVANWPNPFNGIAPSTFEDTHQTSLELIDGGSNGEAVPFGALLVKSRNIDVIIGVDGTSDTDDNFPNGSSPLFTANRTAKLLQTSHQQFPPIPNTTDEFISTGVNLRPTFFGCNPKQSPPEYPLVIYIPNSPPLDGDDPVTNTDTFKLSYTLRHSQLFLDQAHSNTVGGFLPNTNSPDPNWGKCLQCAAIDRARLKVTPVVARSDVCTECFTQYCFDPSTPPSKSALPNRKLTFVDPDPQGFDKVKAFLAKHKWAFIGGGIGLFVLIAALVVFLCCVRKRHMQYRPLAGGDLHAASAYELSGTVGR